MTFDSDDGMQRKWKAFMKKIDAEIDFISNCISDAPFLVRGDLLFSL